MRPLPWFAAAAVAATCFACSPAAPAASPNGHDAPVAASEPRATIDLSLDLPRSAACEESFDLALYGEGGVELVEWEPKDSCLGRRARVRYLPKRVTREALLERIKRLASRAEVQ